MNPLLGMQVVFTPYALQETTERLFPKSRHRSARVRKKLLKRHGGEFRKVPAMFSVEGRLIAHPSFRGQLEAAAMKRDLGGGFAGR